ncbi:SDR family NAD(P)-dependent oxidoreductase [Pseudonocardia sp. KRD291]|uniref:SDR family NAD(P)-dependent oxidoreductase n=1 Tax=Pseudonocardia sp. KRD291 TaxID=2792007 RepID=UPI001C4A5AA9|nr:SDR family NAD(P)-dependent oxidoreductase [Pseudonocardia sp. KRD291]MBW0106104.1 SDR family NAD(P)-dependent oxidoreductase [Pseudonocardia sp. KRD291]
MDLQLGGKRAIVTGASRGIGLAVATTLAAEGADVALVARDAAALERAAAQVEGAGPGRVVAVPADTADDAAVRAMVATVADRLGGVDVLVNAAARPAGAGPLPALDELTDDDVRVELETKLLGYLRCARAVAPLMTAQGWGRIVNISGLNARKSTSLVGSVRNVAVASMTAALAQELGPRGVNVTVVHPGLTVTERIPGMIADRASDRGVDEATVRAELDATTTIGRMTTAQEVADVVAFLASPRSVAVNGDAVAAGGGSPGTVHY